MVNRYLIRLDDACPYMDAEKWLRIENILDRYGVKPLVGIIPANADHNTMIDKEDFLFWDKVHRWIEKGWEIALHGYDHVCISEKGMEGLNPVWKRSEFAGVPLEKQREKIRKGLSFLKEKGLSPHYFFAPSHTFDKNTLESLRLESNIRIISDTIAFQPYKDSGFIFVPQFSGCCIEIPLPGTYTFCFHPNNMDDNAFNTLELFLEKNFKVFVSFEELILENAREKGPFDKILSWLYFNYRKLRRLQ